MEDLKTNTGASGPARSLQSLIPKDIFVGTSLILRRDKRFLYGIRPPFSQASFQILELTGVGGALEEQDETLTAGVLREAREEIDCPVEIVACQDTLVVRGKSNLEWMSFEGQEKPVAVVFRRFRTPPHQPWDDDNRGEACLVVFLADLKGQPRPAMELPALIWISPSQVVEAARKDVPLQKMSTAGAEIIERVPGSLPRQALVRLTDSQEALVLGLEADALRFYQELAGI